MGTTVEEPPQLEMVGTDGRQVTMETEQTTMFVTESRVSEQSVKNVSSYGMAKMASVKDIEQFLERPVKIHSGTWHTTDSIASPLAAIYPWELFLNNTAVAKKISNFQLIRGKLHVKVLLNGTPFHYGLLRALYIPYGGNYAGGALANSVSISSLPGAWLYASSHTEADVEIPFFSMREWIDIAPTGYTGNVTEARGTNMVYFLLWINTALRYAADPTLTTTSLNWEIYCWLSDVELAVPTPYTQAKVDRKKKKDEYSGPGPVESLATTASEVASRLTDLPVIGPFARATQIGASALAGISSIWGWSRPLQLEDPSRYKMEPVSSLAVTSGADTSRKLALDPKNEITVDPTTVGLSAFDDMDFSAILSRESRVMTVEWEATDAADVILQQIPVTPGVRLPLTTYGTSPQYQVLRPTNLFWFTRAFAYWTGSLKYTIRIPSTKFHRGRIQIAYLPRGSAIVPNLDLANLSWNVIMDSSEDQEITFEVPWSQPFGWLPPKEVDINSYASFGQGNGALIFKVVNPLISPANQPVSIEVYISAGHDFRVAKPYTSAMQEFVYDNGGQGLEPTYWYTAHPQLSTGFLMPSECITGTYRNIGGECPAPFYQSKVGEDDFGEDVVDTSELAQVNFGEDVASIRSLIKRYGVLTYSMPIELESLAPLTYPQYLNGAVLPALPVDLRQWFGASGVSTHGYRTFHTFYTWFRGGYAGIRGGARYKFVPTDYRPSALQDLPAANLSFDGTKPLVASISDAVPPILGAVCNECVEVNNGGDMTVNHSVGAIEVEVPYYFPTKFQVGLATNNPVWGSGIPYASTNALRIGSESCGYFNGVNDSMVVGGRVYCAAAEDTQFLNFLCAPQMIRYVVEMGAPN